jgi:hypothetical protein
MREILDPYWASNLKNQVVCLFKYDDGKILTASVTQTAEGNPDWIEIFEKYSIEEIDANTAKKRQTHESNRVKRQMDQQRNAEMQKREALFMAKSDAFEIELVRTSKNMALKSKLRKATSPMEVSIIASMIAMENYNSQQAIENTNEQLNNEGVTDGASANTAQ